MGARVLRTTIPPATPFSFDLHVLSESASISVSHARTDTQALTVETSSLATDRDSQLGAPGTYKPTTSNTGVPAGTSLTVLAGDQTITTDGTTLYRRQITGRVLVRAANVTIQECEIIGTVAGHTSGNSALVDCNHANASNCLIKDCTLIPQTPTVYVNSIIGHDYIALRNRCEHVVDGMGVYNSNAGSTSGPTNVQILGNYVTDLFYMNPDPNQSDNHTHNDCIQIQGGTGTIIRGNLLYCKCDPNLGTGNPAAPGSSSSLDSDYYPSATGQAIGYTPNVSSITGTLVENNYLDYGAASITVAKNSQATSNVGTIRNNYFGRNQPTRSGFKRPIEFIHSGMTATGLPTNAQGTGPDTNNGNVYEDDGTPVIVYRSTTQG